MNKTFNSRGWHQWLLALPFLGLSGHVQAQESCMLVPVSLQERVQRAALVVEARVANERAAFTPDGSRIVTFSQLEVFKVLRGQLPSGPLTVATPGGSVGLQRQVVTGVRTLGAGEQGVFFLEPDPALPGSFRLYAGAQGVIEYDLTDQSATDVFGRYASISGEVYKTLARLTGQRFREVRPNTELRAAEQAAQQPAAQRAAAPVINSFSPTTLEAGEGDILTIKGTGFGATRGSSSVQFRNADDGGQSYVAPVAGEYVSWTNTEIKVRVPGGTGTTPNNPAGTGKVRVVVGGVVVTSTATLTVRYAITEAPYNGVFSRTRLTNVNGTGGYTFQFNADITSRTGAADSYRRALSAWTCATGVNFKIGANTKLDAAVEDKVNIVRFTGSGELGQGTLAQTTSYYSGCFNNAGLVDWHTTEIDMSFNQDYKWHFGTAAPAADQYDFQSVTVHELGHAVQLGHIISSGAVMHYAIGDGETARTLKANIDVAAGNSSVRFSTAGPPVCNTSLMVKATTGCPQASRGEAVLAETVSTPATDQAAAAPFYPNPVENVLHVRAAHGRPVHVTIYDLTGVKVQQRDIDAGTADADVPTGDLRPGLYRVEWTDGQQTFRSTLEKR